MISQIFMDPNKKCPDKRRPLLYLLRRDLQNLYGKESKPPNKIISPLLTSLGIMIGLELLTKYWSGDHEAGTSKIENFLQKVSGLPEEKAIALAQFRHALAHGYKLATIRKKDKRKYSFSISDDPRTKKCIIKINSYNFLINIWKLKKLFINSIDNYKTMLEASFDLRSKFVIVNSYIKDIKVIS